MAYQLCDTRWLARVDSISTFLANTEAANNALVEIQATSASRSSADAYSYIHSISHFSYVYTAVITQYLLAFVRPLSIALQAKDCNLVDCHDNAQELIGVLRGIRSENDKHKMLLRRAVMTAGEIDVQPSKPRTAGKQRHRANAQMEDDSIEGFYRVSECDKLSFMCSTSINTKHQCAPFHYVIDVYFILAPFRFFSSYCFL